MKIAFISKVPGVGKSTSMMLFAHAFARAQRRRVAIFSTGSLGNITAPILQQNPSELSSSIGVFRAMLQTGTINGLELFDYSVRTGRDNVFIFDMFDKATKVTTSFEFLNKTLKSLSNELILLEISGDPESKQNKILLQQCDRVVYVVQQDYKSVITARKYREESKEQYVDSMIYLCADYNDQICSEDYLSRLLGVPRRSLVCIPTCTMLQRAVLHGRIDNFTNNLIWGSGELAYMRKPTYKFIYTVIPDEFKRIIKPISQWPKKGGD